MNRLMDFEFVQAAEKDKAYLLKLRKLTMVEHLERSGQFLSDDEHECRLSNAYSCVHIIVYNKERIGVIKYREGDRTVEVMQLQIVPNYQGKGLGKRIMRQVINNAKPKIVKLSVLKENPALGFYKRLGFNLIDEDKYEFYMQFKQ